MRKEYVCPQVEEVVMDTLMTDFLGVASTSAGAPEVVTYGQGA